MPRPPKKQTIEKQARKLIEETAGNDDIVSLARDLGPGLVVLLGQIAAGDSKAVGSNKKIGLKSRILAADILRKIMSLPTSIDLKTSGDMVIYVGDQEDKE